MTIDLPTGWASTGLTETEREATLAQARDEALKQFLTQRLEPAAEMGGIMLLADLPQAADDGVSFVEVYRYPPGRTPQQVVEQALQPRLAAAGFDTEVEPATVPAGDGLRLVASMQGPQGLVARSTVLLVQLGDQVVGLSGNTIASPQTDTGDVAPDVEAIQTSVRAG